MFLLYSMYCRYMLAISSCFIAGYRYINQFIPFPF
jgi:hypothetical protein